VGGRKIARLPFAFTSSGVRSEAAEARLRPGIEENSDETRTVAGTLPEFALFCRGEKGGGGRNANTPTFAWIIDEPLIARIETLDDTGYADIRRVKRMAEDAGFMKIK